MPTWNYQHLYFFLTRCSRTFCMNYLSIEYYLTIHRYNLFLSHITSSKTCIKTTNIQVIISSSPLVILANYASTYNIVISFSYITYYQSISSKVLASTFVPYCCCVHFDIYRFIGAILFQRYRLGFHRRFIRNYYRHHKIILFYYKCTCVYLLIITRVCFHRLLRF